MLKYLYQGAEWDIDTLSKMWRAIDKVGRSYGLTYDEPQIEIVSNNQMLDAYAFIGLPVIYNHWSFGKQFLEQQRAHHDENLGIALEMIINSTPPIMYCMENNSATVQALVLSHAGCGHADFFKNNELFKKHTRPDFIVNYCKYAKKFVAHAETILGTKRVEYLLDAAHSLKYHAVDKYIRNIKNQRKDNQVKWEARIAAEIENHSKLYPSQAAIETPPGLEENLNFPEENILRFIADYSPQLCEEERELLHIVSNIAQYFFPQPRTKIMNEGWATFWEYQIIQDLYYAGKIPPGGYMEFLKYYTAGIYQPSAFDQNYTGINPYTIGHAIWRDIRRVCTSPDNEDTKWFPDIAGSDWKETLFHIRENYIDSSFILQFLGPKVIRDLKLFSFENDSQKSYYEVTNVHSDEDMRELRKIYSNQHNFSLILPQIEVVSCALSGDRTLELRYTQYNGQDLSEETDDVLEYVEYLWGYGVRLT